MSYLLDAPRTATMRAETGVEAYVLPSETFDEVLAMAPQIGIKIMQSLAERLRTTTRETALQRRQINRLRGGGGAAPDICTTAAEREGERYGEIAMGEIIFLLRTAIDFEDSPVLQSLLKSAILTDLSPPQVHHVPERERLADLLGAIRGDKSRLVDLKTLIARVKGNCVTPASTPEGSTPAMPSNVPGPLHASQMQKMADAEESRAEAKSAEVAEPADADVAHQPEAKIGDPFEEVYDGPSEPSEPSDPSGGGI
jgi:hypothetical protein